MDDTAKALQAMMTKAVKELREMPDDQLASIIKHSHQDTMFLLLARKEQKQREYNRVETLSRPRHG